MDEFNLIKENYEGEKDFKQLVKELEKNHSFYQEDLGLKHCSISFFGKEDNNKKCFSIEVNDSVTQEESNLVCAFFIAMISLSKTNNPLSKTKDLTDLKNSETIYYTYKEMMMLLQTETMLKFLSDFLFSSDSSKQNLVFLGFYFFKGLPFWYLQSLREYTQRTKEFKK